MPWHLVLLLVSLVGEPSVIARSEQGWATQAECVDAAPGLLANVDPMLAGKYAISKMACQTDPYSNFD
jgi:hypothetical protein